MRPPIRSRASRITTCFPAFPSSRAAASPAAPAPTIMTPASSATLSCITGLYHHYRCYDFCMSNEALFVLSALIDILFILVAARRGTTWLYGTIILNLVLVTIFGAKLITVFGLATNAGNVFYACVFLATHFILERHGRQEGVKTVLFGVGLMVLFTLMAQLATAFSESVPGDVAVMSFPLRITFASILAYVFAQRINIAVYDWLKRRTHGKLLWLRSNGANIVGQL